MGIMFTRDAEKRRNEEAQEHRKWEYLTTTSIVEALHYAVDNGWEEKRVQVRAIKLGDDFVEYTIEPFEKDCGCPGILKYDDYFGPLNDSGEIIKVAETPLEGEG